MGVRTCPDCGGAVSAAAEACPHCGRPSRSARHDVVAGRQVVTIERTAKRYKGWLALFTLIFLACAIVIVVSANQAGAESGTLILAILGALVGGVGGLLTRLMIWWHHA